MIRLTKSSGEFLEKARMQCAYYDEWICNRHYQHCENCPLSRAAWRSLADYEDLGMTPKEYTKKLAAAVVDIRAAFDAESPCEFCRWYIPCKGKECKGYMSGDGATIVETGEELPNHRWSCMDFDHGTCPALEDTPCNGCNLSNHWEWRGAMSSRNSTDKLNCEG